MAKTVQVEPLKDIQYGGENRKANSKPFDMDEDEATILETKGIVKKVASAAKTQTSVVKE